MVPHRMNAFCTKKSKWKALDLISPFDWIEYRSWSIEEEEKLWIYSVSQLADAIRGIEWT